MKRYTCLDVILIVLMGLGVAGVAHACSTCPRKDAELLSAHETVARYMGLTAHICRGLTSLCPDRCGDSGALATFAVVRYLHYEKHGEYGDPQAERLLVLVEDQHGRPKVPPLVRMAIRDLKEGATVLLSWHHEYVTRNGASWPERPIVRVLPIPEAGSAGWMAELDRLVRLRQPGWAGGRPGSEVWMIAVAEAIGVYDSLGHGPDPGSDEWRDALHRKVFESEEPAGEAEEQPQ